MRRTRQVLAVVMVTTALCADQVATAAAAHEPVGRMSRVTEFTSLTSDLAGRFVSRLSQSFRRVVPSAAPVQARQPNPAVVTPAPHMADQSARVQPPPLSPFQFRLPPPK